MLSVVLFCCCDVFDEILNVVRPWLLRCCE